jgi:acetoin utilization protein AcuB
MDAREIMTHDVVTAAPTDTVDMALRLLEDQEIRHLPIVDGGRLVGMISDRDLREYRLPLMEELDDPDRADELLATPLSTVMQTGAVALEAGESIAEAIDLMLTYGFGAVPVVDGRDQTLIGIVSYVDILKAVRSTL